MKKSLIILSTVVIALSMNSCVREYTCQCKITFSGEAGLPEPQIREYTLSNTLEQAKQECSSRSATYEVDGITTHEHCELY